MTAIMGPDTDSYANLSPVNAAATLKISLLPDNGQGGQFFDLMVDAAETLTADVWNIFYIQGRCANQKLLQFKITNNSGGSSDIEVMYLRIV